MNKRVFTGISMDQLNHSTRPNFTVQSDWFASSEHFKMKISARFATAATRESLIKDNIGRRVDHVWSTLFLCRTQDAHACGDEALSAEFWSKGDCERQKQTQQHLTHVCKFQVQSGWNKQTLKEIVYNKDLNCELSCMTLQGILVIQVVTRV